MKPKTAQRHVPGHQRGRGNSAPDRTACSSGPRDLVSEFLRTLILSLVAADSSRSVNPTTDFKGGSTFLGMEKLPHTAAVVTNMKPRKPSSSAGWARYTENLIGASRSSDRPG